MSPSITISHIRMISAVADATSLAEAGTRLAISQSSLSRHIAQAERVLGIVLFNRGWAGVSPTEPGSMIIVHADRMMARIATAQHALEAAGARPNELGHRLDWAMFAVLEAVRTCGSASLAARYLQISQPDVSRTLAKIGAAIGRPPFRRSSGRMVATDDVAILADLHLHLLAEMAAMAQTLANLRGGVTGRIVVGMTPFSEQDVIVRIFAEIMEQHGHVRLNAMTGSYAVLADALRKGEIDFILGQLRSPAPIATLTEIHLHDEWFSFIARADHPRALAARSLAQLAAESWVVGPLGTPIRRYFHEVILDEGLMPPLRICEITAFPLTEEMVASSDAIGLLTYSERKRGAMRPGLAILPWRDRREVRKIGLTMRKDQALDPAQTLFIAKLREELCPVGT